MEQLFKTLAHNEAFQAFDNKSNQLGNLSLIEETMMIASAYQKRKRPMLIVKHNLYTAQKLYESLTPLIKDKVLLFGVEESMRIEALAASGEVTANKVEVLHRLLQEEDIICITHVSAFTSFLPNPEVFRKHAIEVTIDKEIEIEELKQLLVESGYERVTYVDQPLTFASRGGIIDVFSMNYDLPLRIEFFDNVIDSIRFFDIATKKTIKTMNEATIICASDILFEQHDITKIADTLRSKFKNNELVEEEIENLEAHQKTPHFKNYYSLLDHTYSIKDYCNSDFIVLSSYEECLDYHQKVVKENITYIQEMSNLQELLPIYTVAFEFYEFTKKDMHIHTFVNMRKPIVSGINELAILNISLDKKLANIKNLHQGYKIYLSVNDLEKEIIMDTKMDIEAEFISFPLVEGFIANKEKIAVYTSKELFDVVHYKAKYDNKFKGAEVLNHYQDLEKGDYIVHKLYGVGQYLGIINKEKDGIHKDYLKVAYKGNDILFIPLEQFRLVRKFVSKEGASPKLNRLGTKDWEKTKAKVSENIKELADRLVKLYALRDKKIGFAFRKDDEMQRAFEADFDYELTKDQATAIKEIKADMESEAPMDRLLCGDVGFGKTEVALRGAFKAVMDNKQVAFLCPTTILSLQHLNTVVRRFRNFPVTIKVVNRFVSQKETTQIKKDLKEGKIDILIGTHRLLSKDIVFKDLGLLIIDEEQRFGVEHKEKIKELKNTIDVLSLSATPIPRTLQMSLVGIRSLSQLTTPPMNRVSVQTYVVEKDVSLIKEIIERELSRNGQVFYLFNKVKEIYNVANKLLNEIKGIRVAVAHGQMSKEDIEDVMYKFTNKEYDVLVCTTIIETGIDIPNANTILVEDADRFGLSQLYQIKGRVGRSDRLAYAYLMYAPHKQLSEIATKRLKSMKEFAALGSGYQIALRDLTIRGAGEMLGPRQAGFIDTVGIDMYMEMLNEAISESKGIPVKKEVEIARTNVKVDAYIPHKFEEEDFEKITLYQQIDGVKNNQELKTLKQETEDLYGKLPKAVALLFDKKRLDLLVNEEYVESFKENEKDVRVIFTKAWSDEIDGVKLFEMATTISKDLKIKYTNQKISVSLKKIKDYLDIIIEFIAQCKKL
ncbi:transcription-repair coupling factor (superfamily II helicase) [Breznakia sp. PF5-3]|uniref:transcription-repair coupling factor n=1 Tax=unclassified Breznakia TaxID=2623764 RepID=UPI0024065E79|nr:MULTISPECIES: transcription-repair coupling factor [unclassified Breznakia]MDF9825734.1 transcription-repair coupling factor (superfamily II helicase) [Breznakia sp. PM6-1]MDF9836080.1 transcription-repair coupling factor (superfamily II helicase) [Breznakia sp. PF5-3]MDF9838299.1 transcription-repair coupling factor (superfamily II helicase) [Breznakia sp. PFB2-8]MDF9860305.1 transcription-repair coupling factor (superfamily II helicase) [Breznakia sp. PH5-24]